MAKSKRMPQWGTLKPPRYRGVDSMVGRFNSVRVHFECVRIVKRGTVDFVEFPVERLTLRQHELPAAEQPMFHHMAHILNQAETYFANLAWKVAVERGFLPKDYEQWCGRSG